MFDKLWLLSIAFLVVVLSACAGVDGRFEEVSTNTCDFVDSELPGDSSSDHGTDSLQGDDSESVSASVSGSDIATSTPQETAGSDTEAPDTQSNIEATDTTDSSDDTDSASDSDTGEDTAAVESCNFGYDEMFVYSWNYKSAAPELAGTVWAERGIGFDASGQPYPLSTHVLRRSSARPLPGQSPVPDGVVLPGYSDDMPLFDRAQAWSGATRCFELKSGGRLLTEDQAYEMYRSIAVKTTGVSMNETPERRNVVGLRGAFPGTLNWHGNEPDRFNDTLVLLWKDSDGVRHVREWPANTDTGAYQHSMASSLRPNRRYRYVNGWHGSTPYNALQIAESGYRVRDDANKNGHWDSDRNGWLGPLTGNDYDRTGSAHNIHMGSEDAPLGSAPVHYWSAGCQVIPGMANWIEFISNAWTGLGDEVDYFLIDARDIAPEALSPCTPKGTHACPYRIETLPFSHAADTSTATEDAFDFYNCSENTDESGKEVVYVLTVDRSGTLSASVECAEPVDVDVHLLDADDADACLDRGHVSASVDVGPGRYFVVVDTYVDNGAELSGAYTLSVSFD